MMTRSSLARKKTHNSGRDGRGEGRGRGSVKKKKTVMQDDKSETKSYPDRKDTNVNPITQDTEMREEDECPIKTIGSREWNNIIQVELEIFKLRKSLTGMQSKEERRSTNELIELYEKRLEELEENLENEDEESMGSTNKNDIRIEENYEGEESDGKKRVEMYEWNKLNYLNHTLKRQELAWARAKANNTSERIIKELKEKIDGTNNQIIEIMCFISEKD